MRLLERLGWICAVFALMALGGQLWSDAAILHAHNGMPLFQGVRGIVGAFVQVLWIVFLGGAVAMAFDKYWGRWAVALAGLFIFCELLNYEVLPSLPLGWKSALDIMTFTWPGVIMGRGPITMVVVAAVSYTVIAKGLARRPSSLRRGPTGTFMRTRETDIKPGLS